MKTLLLTLASVALRVATDKLFLMTVSHHTEDNSQYNNINIGLGYEHTNSNDIGYQLGVYKNSLYSTSTFIGGHYQKEVKKGIILGGSISLVSGYYKTITPVPLFSVQYKNIRLVTSYPMASAAGYVDVINLQFVFKF
jgi:hypothetical protein